MNIYANEGDKIIVTEESSRNGWDYDKKLVKNYLEIGKTYTVDFTVIHSASTEVYIKEVPEVCFNSVNFEDLDEYLEDKKQFPKQ